MSLLSVLKTVGKDLSHVGSWIDDGLQVVGPIIGLIDPPLAPIITIVEEVLGGITSPMTAEILQKLITAFTITESIKVSQAKPLSCMPYVSPELAAYCKAMSKPLPPVV